VSGFDDSQSGIEGVIQSGMAEQPASAKLTAAAAATNLTRDMTPSVLQDRKPAGPLGKAQSGRINVGAGFRE
jgi:hypothetical protein